MLSAPPLFTSISTPPVEPFVLLVDDHQPSLDQLKTVLETAGYTCVTTPSAAEALVYCDTHRPSLVVTDLVMPRLNGEGLARWLRARYPSLPILLITGELLDHETLTRLRGLFDAVITKPLQVEHFLSILRGHMPPGTPKVRSRS